MTVLPGAHIGPYRIVDQIGAGGMGVVYRAHDTRLRRDVALKLLGSDRDSQQQDLLREARTIAALNHPHICTVHEVGTADGVSFIAMELVDGESLRSIIRSIRWSSDRVWRLGRQLADALEHAHTHGVIHRDFKTANVMITGDGRAKVVDFGIAVRAPAATEHTVTAGNLESGAQIPGTVAYMAPEVLQGTAPDIRSDIWALGVVLYEMVCRRPPFDGRTMPEVIAAILRDPPAPFPAGTPLGLVRVVERCLAKDPLHRPAHAAEVALALEAAEPASVTAEVDSPSRKWRFGHRSPLLTAAGALLAALGLAYWLWLPVVPAPMRFANPVQVTTAVGVEEFPAWSPDGRMLAFVAAARDSAANSTTDSSAALPP
jgi:serine/threonine protein kinase